MNIPIKLITFATDIDGSYQILQESATNNDFELETLGMGVKWEGFTMRYRYMKEYLDAIPEDKESQNQLIVFIDGYDTFVLNNKETLLNRYYSFNRPIVYGAQWNRIVGDKWSRQIIKWFSSNFDIVLNAGSYMGPVWALKNKFHMLASHFDLRESDQNDQKLLNKSRRLSPDFFKENVTIDKRGIIFHNASYYSSAFYTPYCMKSDLFNDIAIDKDNGKLIIRDVGIEPVFLSGPGNVDLVPYIKYKGYDIKNIKHRDHVIYGWEFIREFALELTIYYGVIGIVLSLILFVIWKCMCTFIPLK